MTRALRRLRMGCAVLLGMAACLVATASSGATVAVVLSEEGGAYTEVAEKIRASLTRDTVHVLPLAAAREHLNRLGADFAVAVGVAASQLLAEERQTPVLSVLVPRAAFEQVAKERGRHDTRGFSAIYLDQPYVRQFQLIRLLFPEKQDVGVLLGPSTLGQLPLLRSAAKQTRFELAVEKVEREADVIPALNRLLPNSSVFFAFPDPLVHNRATIQGVLLTTYRHRVPVVGFSVNYVRAGALVAVYTSPTQIGQQAAEIIQAAAAERGRALPAPRHPRYFSVATNTQVARSLGLEIEGEASLIEKLKRATEQEP